MTAAEGMTRNNTDEHGLARTQERRFEAHIFSRVLKSSPLAAEQAP